MFQSVVKKIFILTVILPFMAHSQDKLSYLPPVFMDKDRVKKIQKIAPFLDQIYQEYAQKNHFPGYAFALLVDGQILHIGKGGYADLEKKTLVDAHTVFRVASMTKGFTAMAILKLRDEGKLRLDDPVSLYIPAMKKQKLTQDSSDVTLRDLLTHGAGFPEDNPWGDRNLDKTDAELNSLIEKHISLSNAPDIGYEYSNLGFALLGLVIKKVSGMSYQDYVATTIWQPLGMNETAWEFAKVPAKQLAHGYKWEGNHWEEEEMLHDGSFAAMGGMMSSIDSFSHYVALHQAAWPARDDAEHGPLKRASLREMHQALRFNTVNPHARVAGEECETIAAYSYGLRWLRDCQSKVYVGHSGGLPGFGSNWAFLPEYGIGIILFANTTYAPTDAINLDALNIVIKKAYLKPRTLPASTILEERKHALLQLLPDWSKAQSSGIFAANFFLDSSLATLREKTQTLFAQAGMIKHVGALVPENQLRGYFLVSGDYTDLKISFTLSPDNPALIQHFEIEEMPREEVVV